VEGRRVEHDEPARGLRTRQLLFTAFALSIDNLAVGFALAVYHIQIVLAAATMGVISVAMSLVGLELGHRLGKHVEAWSEEIGGGVLILVGLAIAAGLLH
jgi:putative Mn2+ efflux pump MntP